MQQKQFPKGHYIFREGGNPGEVYLILEGKVNIVKEAEGSKVVLASLGKNSIFGEMALIDNKPRSASAVATEDSVCMVLGVIEFNEKLEAMDPFIRGIFRVLTNTVRETTKKSLNKK